MAVCQALLYLLIFLVQSLKSNSLLYTAFQEILRMKSTTTKYNSVFLSLSWMPEFVSTELWLCWSSWGFEDRAIWALCSLQPNPVILLDCTDSNYSSADKIQQLLLPLSSAKRKGPATGSWFVDCSRCSIFRTLAAGKTSTMKTMHHLVGLS